MPTPSSSWPSYVASDTGLYVAKNNLQGALSAPISAVDTTIPLFSSTGFPASGFVTIGTELIKYAGVSGNNLTGCVRGSEGAAAPALAGANVYHNVLAQHHNALKNEIIALETDLEMRIGLPGSPKQLRGIVLDTSSATFTIGDEQFVNVDASSANSVGTLPPASTSLGRSLTVKKVDATANTVTVDGNGSDLIDGAFTKVITVQYEAYTFVCDGSSWSIV